MIESFRFRWPFGTECNLIRSPRTEVRGYSPASLRDGNDETASCTHFSCEKVDGTRCNRFEIHSPEARPRVLDRGTHFGLGTRLEVFAWVIMPQHVHMIIYDDSDSITMTRFNHSLKRPFALEVLNRFRTLKTPFLEKLKHGNGHRFWQTGGGYDRVVVDDELMEKIRYIHANPVVGGLVKNPEDYRWSSAAFYCDRPYVGPPISLERLPFSRGEVV